ncbi:MAG: N-acetyl-gamma-glutamyl-phosphate reductase, partial [Bdellovibrionales bacterium]|nr:N-acetyl-gamma-glutamyl-phosphate reductase [Bdellovibrionales bacterium]
ATGYMGGEALRILLEHPEVEIAWATSRKEQLLGDQHRNLFGIDLDFIRPEDAGVADVVFFAAPTGTAMDECQRFLDMGAKVIDLGSDFRLRDRSQWERVYGRTHSCWNVAEEAVYGIPELYRSDIKNARVIANPGCMSSATILGLAPLAKEKLIELDKIVVDGISSSGAAGAALDVTMHHPEVGNNVVPYNVVNHRHSYEMEQELGLLAEAKVTVHFTPVYIPITRGILVNCHCFPTRATSRQEVLELYHDFYAGESFVTVFDLPKEQGASWQYKPYPWVAMVSGTNHCQIGLDYDEQRNRLVVFSVLDSLGKGGAHVGVQNLNLICNLDERTGLGRRGNHPY